MTGAGGGTLRYAGFWRRLWALLLDTALFTALSLPLLALIYGPDVLHSPPPQGTLLSVLGLHGVAEFFITYVLPMALLVAFWQRRGATPGKRLLDCQIIEQATGRAPRTGQAILRVLGYVVSALPLYLGFLWIGGDRRKQGWHDKIAGTVVVHHAGDELAGRTLEEWMREVRL